MKNLTIGADIELFIYDKIKKEITSAIDLVPGTKKEPVKLSKDGFAMHHDNVLAEFNIPPVTNKLDFYENIQKMIVHINNVIGSHYTAIFKPSAKIDYKFLENPLARQMGCDPDYNAYDGSKNEIIIMDDMINLRSAGFHIHIGYKNHNEYINRDIIKMMDLFLGVPSIIIDIDRERRLLYGKAGCYRNQPHGVEYRTLSSLFASTPGLIEWCFNQTVIAFEMTMKGWRYNEPQHIIEDTINNVDIEMAEELMDKYKIIMPSKMYQTT